MIKTFFSHTDCYNERDLKEGLFMPPKAIFWVLCKWFTCLHPDKPPAVIPLDGTQIIAHRGLTSEHLENTLEALLAAFHVGDADGVEFDVQLSADKTPWVFHDRHLLRLTGVDKNIDELSDKEIKKLSQEYNGQTYQIATLNQVLDKMPRDKIINVELKETVKIFGEQGTRRVCDILRNHRDKLLLISSFDPEILKMVNEITPKITLGLLIDEGIQSIIPSFLAVSIVSYLIPHKSLVSRKRAKKINEEGGPPLIVWGHKAIGDEENFLIEKIPGIITDIPEELMSIRPK